MRLLGRLMWLRRRLRLRSCVLLLVLLLVLVLEETPIVKLLQLLGLKLLLLLQEEPLLVLLVPLLQVCRVRSLLRIAVRPDGIVADHACGRARGALA